MPEQELDLLQFVATLMTQTGARAEVMWSHVSEIAVLARLLHNTPDDFGTEPMRAIRPDLLIARKIGPSVIFASVIQFSRATTIQYGTGTVRT